MSFTCPLYSDKVRCFNQSECALYGNLIINHFNQVGHSINDVRLTPIEIIRSKRDSVRKAREAHLINKAKTLHPFGINKRDEARPVTYLTLI